MQLFSILIRNNPHCGHFMAEIYSGIIKDFIQLTSVVILLIV